MEKKATKTGLVIYEEYSILVEYEYKGKTYYVKFPKCWASSAKPAHIQHKEKQAEIDKRIEEESKPKKEIRKEDTVEYALDMLWKYCEE